jgi:hypothetical protein
LDYLADMRHVLDKGNMPLDNGSKRELAFHLGIVTQAMGNVLGNIGLGLHGETLLTLGETLSQEAYGDDARVPAAMRKIDEAQTHAAVVGLVRAALGLAVAAGWDFKTVWCAVQASAIGGVELPPEFLTKSVPPKLVLIGGAA